MADALDRYYVRQAGSPGKYEVIDRRKHKQVVVSNCAGAEELCQKWADDMNRIEALHAKNRYRRSR